MVKWTLPVRQDMFISPCPTAMAILNGPFLAVNKNETEHRSELAKETIAALLCPEVNCSSDSQSYEQQAKTATTDYH